MAPRILTMVAGISLALLCAQPAAATTYPAGFSQVTLASGLSGAVAVDWAPDGRMFIAERPGVVKVVDPDGTKRTLLDISDHVNNWGDRGLLGIAVDSHFEQYPYVYLYYTYDADPSQREADKTGRLTRVTVLPDDSVANPSSPEKVLLGTYPLQPCPVANNSIDCIPGDTSSHHGGTVRSAPDGTVWLSTGQANCCGKVGWRSYRTYNDQSLAGKIIHVDRNGKGLAVHPFCPGDGNLNDVCTKIYAKGFRNPFRFSLRPRKRPVVADVGEASQEEVDFVSPGGNYGWPCYEGTIHTPLFQNQDKCQELYASEGITWTEQPPAWSYSHNGRSAAVIGGPLYTGTAYPSRYKGTIFVGDFEQGWLKRLVVDGSDHVTTVRSFATGWLGVDLELAPDGNLAFADFSSVKEIAYTP